MRSDLNVESLVRRNSVVYRCLTPSPAQALLFGNGTMGGMVHTPADSLHLQVARGDIWNERAYMGAIAAVRVRGDEGLFTKALAVRQECNLYEATVRITIRTTSGEVGFTLTCLRGKDLLVLRIEDRRTHKADFLVSLDNWHEGESVTAAGDNGLETTHLNRTSQFAEMNQRVRVNAAAMGINDPLLGRAWALAVRASTGRVDGRGTLRLAAGDVHEVLISTACIAPRTGVDGVQAAREACRQLANASPSDLARWQEAHAQYWREFWSRSCISLHSNTGDAEYEERLWYVSLYTIACGSGGPYPLRFNGGPFLLDRDARTWDGGYWFQNMREIYWPLLASGHWEFMQDLFRLYSDAQPFVRAQTQQLFKIDAPCFRETQTFWGMDTGSNLLTGEFNPVTHHYFSSNIECCLLMDWYFQASGDEAFLREKFYPFLKEILEFFRQYAVRSSDGLYHLSPVSSLETWLQVTDDMPNLCGLHYFLPRAIGLGERFGESRVVLDRWKEFQQHLAPLPVGRWTVARKFMNGIPSAGIHAEEIAIESELTPTASSCLLPACWRERVFDTTWRTRSCM